MTVNIQPRGFTMRSDHEHYEAAFREAKIKALRFIEHFNEGLPTDHCPFCGVNGHVPGLPCPECSHCYEVPWAILLPGEWGYEVVAINNRKNVIMEFYVED